MRRIDNHSERRIACIPYQSISNEQSNRQDNRMEYPNNTIALSRIESLIHQSKSQSESENHVTEF